MPANAVSVSDGTTAAKPNATAATIAIAFPIFMCSAIVDSDAMAIRLYSYNYGWVCLLLG